MELLKYESLRDWKYRVLRGFTYETDIKPENKIQSSFSSLDTDGLITVEKGFCWDGPTGGFDTENSMLASLLHDIGCNYRVGRLLADKEIEQFDELFYNVCIDYGMSKLRAGYMYRAISVNTKIRYGV